MLSPPSLLPPVLPPSPQLAAPASPAGNPLMGPSPTDPGALLKTLFGGTPKIGRGGPGTKRRMKFRRPKAVGRFK